MNNNINSGIPGGFILSVKQLISDKVNIPNDLDFFQKAGSISNPASEGHGIIVKISYTLLFVALMAISANTFTYLPFTPIPVTMQVLTVLLSAITLGSRLAFFSQLQYIFAGLLGAPVFAGFKSGLSVFSGPTAGYIAGFLAAAFITGYVYENNIIGIVIKSPKSETLKNFQEHYNIRTISMFVSCVIGVLVIYSCGFIYLYGFIYMIAGIAGPLAIFKKTLKLGIIPFIIIDFLKILVIINLDKVFKIKK